MEENEKVVDMNLETGEEKITPTEFVEPKGKLRKAIKWIVGGAALTASAIFGVVIGKALGDRDNDSGDETDDNDSNETEE